MNEPLRTCNHCGLEAHTEKDLSLFVTYKQSKHGKMNFCNECHLKKVTQWNHDNPGRNNVATKKWRQNNPDKKNALTAKRRATKLNATPAWYTTEKKRIKFLYTTAQLSGLQVDHIIPLQHELVCGLHTLDNLQLLTPEENKSKSNNFEI